MTLPDLQPISYYEQQRAAKEARRARSKSLEDIKLLPGTALQGVPVPCIHRGSDVLEFLSCGCRESPPAFNCFHADAETTRCITTIANTQVAAAVADIGYLVCDKCGLRAPHHPTDRSLLTSKVTAVLVLHSNNEGLANQLSWFKANYPKLEVVVTSLPGFTWSQIMQRLAGEIKTEYLLILDDLVTLTDDPLPAMVSVLQSDSQVGAVTGAVGVDAVRHNFSELSSYGKGGAITAWTTTSQGLMTPEGYAYQYADIVAKTATYRLDALRETPWLTEQEPSLNDHLDWFYRASKNWAMAYCEGISLGYQGAIRQEIGAISHSSGYQFIPNPGGFPPHSKRPPSFLYLGEDEGRVREIAQTLGLSVNAHPVFTENIDAMLQNRRVPIGAMRVLWENTPSPRLIWPKGRVNQFESLVPKWYPAFREDGLYLIR